jgi:hypothetical protein
MNFACAIGLRPPCPYATKDGQLKPLKVAIDLLKPDLPEPFALSLDWRQNIGLFIVAVDKLATDFLP